MKPFLRFLEYRITISKSEKNATMKSLVIEKSRYILSNTWLGLLLPAGVHRLLNLSLTPQSIIAYKQPERFQAHPAEFRLSRTIQSTNRP